MFIRSKMRKLKYNICVRTFQLPMNSVAHKFKISKWL